MALRLYFLRDFFCGFTFANRSARTEIVPHNLRCTAHGIVPPLLCLVLCKGFRTSLGKTGKTDSNHVFKQCCFPFLSLNSDHIHLSLSFFPLAHQEPLHEELTCMFSKESFSFLYFPASSSLLLIIARAHLPLTQTPTAMLDTLNNRT